ncbi:glycine zipper family protein [Methanococcoides sp. LMO-2]|uniref:Glycine zipper family protein n=1 Tax=Methanococcoides cohabitans TaxID=3136559 RepID=A0ABU9KPV7_9EURY
MKLYVICTCGEKIYLEFDSPIRLRSDLNSYMTVKCPRCRNRRRITNRNVYAEKSSSDATTGAIIGGLIGLLAGPEGALIGAGLGSLIGADSNKNDDNAVRRFNRS